MKNKDLASDIISKQFWIIIILIVCLAVSNILWVVYFNQYDYTTSEEITTLDGTGTNNYIGNDGSITNGN